MGENNDMDFDKSSSEEEKSGFFLDRSNLDNKPH